jgi:hypothetical protein
MLGHIHAHRRDARFSKFGSVSIRFATRASDGRISRDHFSCGSSLAAPLRRCINVGFARDKFHLRGIDFSFGGYCATLSKMIF